MARVSKSIGKKGAGRGSDIVMLRLPDGLKAKVAALAEGNGRSMNSELIDAVLHHIERPSRMDGLEAKIEIMSRWIDNIDRRIGRTGQGRE